MESLKSMTSALLVIVPFVLVFSLVFKEIRRQKRKWAALHELSRRLEELEQDILVVSTPTVPDKKIEQELGGNISGKCGKWQRLQGNRKKSAYNFDAQG